MPSLREVFIPGGQPRATYVSRDHFRLEEQVEDFLFTAHALFVVTGPTKSGKTVLCRNVVPRSDAIWLSGGSLADEADLWRTVIDKHDSPIVVQDEKEIGHEVGKISELKASAGLGVLAGGGTLSDRAAKSETRRSSGSRDRALAQLALDGLIESGKVLIIDDFHYLPRDLQGRLIRAFKQPIFDGAKIILLAVPHRAYDAVRVEREMTGRVRQLQIPDWTADELEQIPGLGFPQLNATLDADAKNEFVSQSFGSPHLMQWFCQSICLINNVREPLEKTRRLVLDDKLAFFRRIAADTSKTAFDRLAIGPRQRSDRLERAFADGGRGDIYVAVLKAVATTGPRTTLTYEDIRAQLREIVEGATPQAHEISRVLAHMTRIAREEIGGEPVLEWEDDKTLYIADPFFAFYLRWGELVRPGTG